jgi:hypothetical protein
MKMKYSVSAETETVHPGQEGIDSDFRTQLSARLNRPAVLELTLFKNAGVIGNPI